LESFGEIPMRTRRTIVLKARESPKDNPVAWIAACVTNHRNREMQKRLSAKAQNSGAYCSTAQSITPCLSEASASFSPRGPTSPCSSNFGSQAANVHPIGSTLPASQRSDSQPRPRCHGLGSRDTVELFIQQERVDSCSSGHVDW
jgi:hypothetical protein